LIRYEAAVDEDEDQEDEAEHPEIGELVQLHPRDDRDLRRQAEVLEPGRRLERPAEHPLLGIGGKKALALDDVDDRLRQVERDEIK